MDEVEMPGPTDECVAGPLPRRPWRRAALLAGLIVVAAVVAGATLRGEGTGGARTEPGPLQPAFSVGTLSGGTFEFPTGRPTALYFTGSTCASCLPKAEALGRIERQAGDAVAVLGVDIDGFDTEEMFRDWITHAGSPRHAFAMDRDFHLLELFDVAALSTVIVTDGDGRLVWRSTEHATEDELRAVLRRAGLR